MNTTGPWVQVLPCIKLKDVSIQIDHRQLEQGCISVWAVSHKGDVLCRTGVTAACPQVRITKAFYCIYVIAYVESDTGNLTSHVHEV